MAAALTAIGAALAGKDAGAAADLLVQRARIAADLALASSTNAKVVVQNGGGDAATLGAALGLAQQPRGVRPGK